MVEEVILMNKQITNNVSQPRADKIFDIVNVTIISILGIILLWPLIFVVSASLSNPSAVWNGEVLLFPVGLNIDGYKYVFENKDVWLGYGNTLFYTVIGTIINLILTICAAYPLSRKDFVPRNFLMAVFVFTMYFNGGLIPTYLVVSDLGIINTRWALLLPTAVSIFNVIITRTYFQTSIPKSLQEAAEIDGCNTAQFLIRIVLPLSAPIIAVMALYYGVAHWNEYFNAMIYLQDKELYPLQLFLREILIQNQVTADMFGLDAAELAKKAHLAETMKYSLIIVASLPILIVYPFIQKYFVKGIMIGAIKG